MNLKIMWLKYVFLNLLWVEQSSLWIQTFQRFVNHYPQFLFSFWFLGFLFCHRGWVLLMLAAQWLNESSSDSKLFGCFFVRNMTKFYCVNDFSHLSTAKISLFKSLSALDIIHWLFIFTVQEALSHINFFLVASAQLHILIGIMYRALIRVLLIVWNRSI